MPKGKAVALEIGLTEDDDFHSIRQTERAQDRQGVLRQVSVQARLQADGRALVIWPWIEPDSPVRRRQPDPGLDGERGLVINRLGEIDIRIARRTYWRKVVHHMFNRQVREQRRGAYKKLGTKWDCTK